MAVLQPHLAFPSPEVPGDFNHDGVADAADFVVWRKTEDSSVPIGAWGDADRNGVVQVGDQSIWTSNFGMVNDGGAGQGGSSVPEPSPFWLCAMGILAFVTSRARAAH
jgi:hypothetical protein